MTNQINNQGEENNQQVTFARGLGLFDATMIGVGGMIGAGIFVLTGVAAGRAGPASILAFGLNGAVTLLTAMVYAELASSIPEAGGGYSYVKRAFPDVFGFIAGIWLWFAYTVACSLYAAGFGHYFLEFFSIYFPGTHHLLVSLAGAHAAVVLFIILIGICFIALNIRGAGVTGKIENVIVVAKIAVLAVFVVYGIERIFADIPAAKAEFTPFFPMGFSGVFVAMGLTFIAFEGYDLIATVAEEIKDPEVNIPKATFISLAITMVIYILVILVSLGAVHAESMPSWQFLGKYQETAIVRAAAAMMPGVGVFLIVMGGVLSTMSALNATVMASSRVVFSMARDGWLPAKISAIHSKRRTPHIAILLTGAIFLVVAIVLPVELLGSAASIMFLLVFAMVHLSLIALRRKNPELKRPYKIPFYPLLPLVGFTVNIALAIYQFTFNPLPWIVVGGWTLAGLLLYFAVFEKGVKETGPQMLEVEMPTHKAKKEIYRVVVPLANPHTVERLIDIAAPIAKAANGKIIALSVTEVPEQLPIHDGLKFVHHRRPLIRAAKARAEKYGVELSSDLRVAHSLKDALLETVKDHDADLLVMGWKGFSQTRDKIFGEITDQMIRHCPCDLAVIKNIPGKVDRILLATAGGPNAELGASFARSIASLRNATIDACVVVPALADEAAEQEALKRIDKSLEDLDPKKELGRHIVKSDSIAAGIAKASREYDMVIIGAAPVKPFKYTIAGEIPEKVARYSSKSVMLVRRWEGTVTGLFRKLFG